MDKEASSNCWDTAVSKIPILTEQSPFEGIQWVRLVDDITNDSLGDSQRTYEFSPPFLEEISGAVSNERELLKLDLSLQSKIDFSEAILTRNTLNVMCAVVMKLQRQIAAIVCHNGTLPQWPRNDKQFHAARYRRSQLRILSSVSGSLLGDLRSFVGLDPRKMGNVQIVRLEHILLESPKEFLIHFRACLNAGLGTRKATKIREKQWVECAFALWMCGLWLWDPSGLKRFGPLPGSDFSATISQWLCWVRRVYGDSPETENLIKINRNTRLTPHQSFGDSGSEAESLHNHVSADYYNEDYLVAESYLRVAQAAVKKNEDSIYNHPEVTVKRLLWCINVLRQEGFMCPDLEGRTGDEHDQYVLFLEIGNERQDQRTVDERFEMERRSGGTV